MTAVMLHHWSAQKKAVKMFAASIRVEYDL